MRANTNSGSSYTPLDDLSLVMLVWVDRSFYAEEVSYESLQERIDFAAELRTCSCSQGHATVMESTMKVMDNCESSFSNDRHYVPIQDADTV